MKSSAYPLPKNRLQRIPPHLRLAHGYCFFLHDECARILVEYENARAHVVNFKFRNKADAKKFSSMADESTIAAMRACGYGSEARQVILNTITMAMVSDCLHHIYEALRCIEKRKVIVALNLLRKPLTDNLMYLSWMHGDEGAFYEAFSKTGPTALTPSSMGNRRKEIITAALTATEIADVLNAEFVIEALFERNGESGFQKLFQHAVHLITAKHVELKTDHENFNFIFKNYEDDDLYEAIYYSLPHSLLYLSHVIMGLFNRIAPMDDGAKRAFDMRSIIGLYLVEGGENEQHALDRLAGLNELQCDFCNKLLVVTTHNAARLVLSESYRCTGCGRVQGFPFSWLF